jgi:hypothetical protein
MICWVNCEKMVNSYRQRPSDQVQSHEKGATYVEDTEQLVLETLLRNASLIEGKANEQAL